MDTNGLKDKRERRPEIDALKGILISLIVLGHNYYFSRYFPSGFNVLYNFHVASFLVLPFLFLGRKQKPVVIRDRLSRILVPHYIFFTLALLVYFFVFVQGHEQEVRDWAKNVVYSLILANEAFFEKATGLRIFWFLPAIALVSLILFLYEKLKSRTMMASFVIFFIVWHGLIGMLHVNLAQYIPWGAVLVGFLVLPGLIVYWLSEKINWRTQYDIVLIAVWILFLSASARYNLYLALAGDTQLPGIAAPVRLLFHDLFLVVSFFALYRIGWWLKTTVLENIGRYSLQIFLFHPFIWQAFWISIGKNLDASGAVGKVFLIALTLTATIAIAFWLARAIEVFAIKSIIFPRTMDEWLVNVKAVVATR